MILHPARYEDESKELYALRRWTENQVTKWHKTEPVIEVGISNRRRQWRTLAGGTSHRQCKRWKLYD